METLVSLESEKEGGEYGCVETEGIHGGLFMRYLRCGELRAGSMLLWRPRLLRSWRGKAFVFAGFFLSAYWGIEGIYIYLVDLPIILGTTYLAFE